MQSIDISHTQEIYTVSRLNREVRFILEGSFPLLWVEGEISNFTAHTSGHWYFCVKDANAQINCAMFSSRNRQLNFTPKNGMHVILKAQVSLYELSGRYQLIVEQLEEAGVGKLQRAFEALKKKLQEAGLFDTKHKKPLPVYPNCIGIVTSSTGAALRDILHVLKRRYASAPIIIYPTLVQGELAADNIVSAIKTANRRKECDVIILARGGGSLEDLWPFNEEKVAYAIHHSELPIISGVGHEIDFTIADFVADVRAPTPSAAAELVACDKTELLVRLQHYQDFFARQLKQKLFHLQKNLDWINKHLQQQHPKHKLHAQSQQLDLLEAALIRLQIKLLTENKSKLENYHTKLWSHTPRHVVRDFSHQLQANYKHLKNLIEQALQTRQQTFNELTIKLDALSPLATLKRGYAIATRVQNQQLLKSPNEVITGDKINLQLAQGTVKCTAD